MGRRMTKLQEIENSVSTRSGDVEWLINRIRVLQHALIECRSLTFELQPDKDGLNGTPVMKIRTIAYQALESE
jgi:hypothetical protein